MRRIDDLKPLIIYNGFEMEIVESSKRLSKTNKRYFNSTLVVSVDVSNSILSPLFDVCLSKSDISMGTVNGNMESFGFSYFKRVSSESEFLKRIHMLIVSWVNELSQEYEGSGKCSKEQKSSLSSIEKMHNFFVEMDFSIKQKWQERSRIQLANVCEEQEKVMKLDKDTVLKSLSYMMIYFCRNGLDVAHITRCQKKENKFDFEENFGLMNNNVGINSDCIEIMNADYMQNVVCSKKENVLSIIPGSCLAFRVNEDVFRENFTGIDFHDENFEKRMSVHHKNKCLSHLSSTLKNIGVSLLECELHNDLSVSDFEFDKMMIEHTISHWNAKREHLFLDKNISLKKSTELLGTSKRKNL